MATCNCRYVGDVLFHQPHDPILCAMVFDPSHPTIINGIPTIMAYNGYMNHKKMKGKLSFEGPYLSGKYG